MVDAALCALIIGKLVTYKLLYKLYTSYCSPPFPTRSISSTETIFSRGLPTAAPASRSNLSMRSKPRQHTTSDMPRLMQWRLQGREHREGRASGSCQRIGSVVRCIAPRRAAVPPPPPPSLAPSVCRPPSSPLQQRRQLVGTVAHVGQSPRLCVLQQRRHRLARVRDIRSHDAAGTTLQPPGTVEPGLDAAFLVGDHRTLLVEGCAGDRL